MSGDEHPDRTSLQVFRDLAERPANEQDAMLAELPSPMAQRVRAMLRADAKSDPRVDAEPAEGLVAALARELNVPGMFVEPSVTAVGPYAVVGELGRGGMGVVYLAEQDAPRRLVAVKVLRSEHRRHHSEMFRAEANALATLIHPGIPQVYAVGDDDGAPWLAMEWVQGQPLDAWAANQAGMEVLNAMVSVCEAVQAAHETGLTHRDLKPSNVLVTDSGQPKVMDFGLAATAGDLAPTRGGTRGYMSPEAADRPSPQGDVFALGRILEAVLPALPWPYSEDVPFVLARATDPDPAARYINAGALGIDLARVRDAEPIAARDATLFYRLRRYSWRNRAVGRTLAAVSVFVLLVAAAAWMVQEYQRQTLEAQTTEALVRLKPDVEALLLAGKPDEAESRIRAVLNAVAGASHTAAAAAAWQNLAAAAEGLGNLRAARRALAEAYLSAGSDRTAVMGHIVEHHLATGDEHSAILALGQLRALSGTANVEPTLVARVSALRRDLVGAAAGAPTDPSAPLFAALSSGARRLPYQAWGVMPITIGGEDLRLVIDEENQRLVLARPDPTLSEWASGPFPPQTQFGYNLPRPVGGSWIVRRQVGGTVEVLDLECSSEGNLCMEPVTSMRGSVPLSAARDGDSVLLGFGPGPDSTIGRNLVRLGADGAVFTASTELASSASDLNHIQVVDIDQDGEDELVVALGPWRAYEVRVMERHGEAWRSRSRVRLGQTSDLEVVRTPQGLRVVVPKADIYPSREAWPADRPTGEPAGIYVLADLSDALDVTQFLDSPLDDGISIANLTQGDFDGDGIQDLAVQIGGSHTWLLRGLADGSYAGDWVISDLVPMGVLEADDDAADELIVRIPGDEHHSWILGAGPDSLPRLEAQPVQPSSALSGATRALASAGLIPEAADRVLLETGGLEPARRAEAEIWAAEQLITIGRFEEAAEALEVAADRHPSVAVDALTRAAELWQILNDNSRRLNAIVELRDRTGHRSWDGEIRAISAPVEASIEWEQGDAVPVDLVPIQPLAVQLHPPGSLIVDAMTGPQPVVQRDVRWEGDALEVTLNTRLTWIEFGAGIGIQLRHGEDQAFGVSLTASGGGTYAAVAASCSGRALAETEKLLGPAVEPGAVELDVRLSIRANRASGHIRCVVQIDDDAFVIDHLTPLRTDIDPSMSLELFNPRQGHGRVRAEVRSLKTVGLVAEPVQPGPEHDVAAGRTASGLRIADPATAAMVAVRLGDLEQAARLLHDAELEPGGALPAPVAQSLRQRPSPTLDVIQRSRPEWARAVLREAYRAVERPTSDALALLVHPFVVSSVGDGVGEAGWALLIVRHLIELGELDRAEAIIKAIDLSNSDLRVQAGVFRERARLAAVLGQDVRAREHMKRSLLLDGDPELARVLVQFDPLLAPLVEP